MPDNKDVNAASSSANSDGNPAGEGKNRVMPDGRSVEDVWAESQRKTKEIETLKANVSDLQAKHDELVQKLEEGELTRSEKKELDATTVSLKEAAKQLRGQENAQPWIELLREEAETISEKKAVEAQISYEVERGNEYLEDRATELKMKPAELAKFLSPYAMKYHDKRPERRNALAFRDWQQDQAKLKDLNDREAKIKQKEEQDQAFRENRGRTVRNSNVSQQFSELDKAGRIKATVDLIG